MEVVAGSASQPACHVDGVARARSVWRAGELHLRTERRVIVCRLEAGSMVSLRWMAAVPVVCIVAHAVICFPFCVSFIVDYCKLCGSHRIFLGVHQVRPRIQFRKACFSRGEFLSAVWCVLCVEELSCGCPEFFPQVGGCRELSGSGGGREYWDASKPVRLVEGVSSGVGHVPEFVRLCRDVVPIRFPASLWGRSWTGEEGSRLGVKRGTGVSDFGVSFGQERMS